MANISDVLADATISRALILQRIANGLSRDVASQYQSIIDDIVKTIKSTDSEITIRNMNKLIKELKSKVETDLPIYQDLNDLGIQEATWAATSINTAVGVDIVSRIAPASAIEKIVNTSLMEGATIKSWFQSLDASMQVDLDRAVKLGVSIGETTPQIAKRVQDKLLISKSQAESITRTAIATVSNQARDATWMENSELFKGWEHLSVLDNRTSTICATRDGAYWTLDGKGLNEKGKKFNFRRPPLHFRCRSLLLPILKSGLELDIQGTRATMDGQVSADITFDKWFDSKDKAFQEEFLGKGRYNLYKKGTITFNDLVNQNGRELTLKELKEKYS